MQDMRTKLCICVIVAVSASSSNAQIPDPCLSTADLVGGPVGIFICPAGDGVKLSDVGAIIEVVIRDFNGIPVALIPASDFWLIGWADGLSLWASSGSSNADAPTDVNGYTTISGTIAGGGCDDGVAVVVQGIVLLFPLNCFDRRCLSVQVRGLDVNGDLTVDLIDLAAFAASYPSPPDPYDACTDFDFDGDKDLVDFVIFATHFLHTCQ